MKVTLLSRQLTIQGYQSHGLRALRSGLRGGGCYVGMPLAVRIRGGQGPQAVQCRFEIAPELQRLEALIEDLEVRADAGREHAGGAESMIGRLGPVVDAMHVGAVALLGEHSQL